MRLGQMMMVDGRCVADDLSEDRRIPPARALKRFQCQDRRTFAERETVPMRVEWTAHRRRKRLQGIKPGKNHLAEPVITSRHGALGLAGRISSQAWPTALLPEAQALEITVIGPLKPRASRTILAWTCAW